MSEGKLPVIEGRYELLSQIGRGPAGTVHLAKCGRTGKQVAVKRPHPTLCRHGGAKRFLDSVRKVAQLAHPNLAQVLDFGTHDGLPYVVREWLDGDPVQDVIREKAPIKPSRACELLGQLLGGLSAIHSAGLLHLAIKPENIFVLRPSPGQVLVKLSDPGDSVALIPDPIQRFPKRLGFAAPEQFVKAQLAAWTDVYSLGVLLYELVSGSTVIPAGAICGEPGSAAVSGRDRAIRAVSERFADPLSAVLNRALAHHPDERPHTAEEFASELARYASHLPRYSSAGSSAKSHKPPQDTARGRTPIRKVPDQNLRHPKIPKAPAMPKISFGYDQKWSAEVADTQEASPLRRWLKSKRQVGTG